MKTTKLFVLFAVVLTIPIANTVVAADQPTHAAPAPVQAAGGYLGVLLEPVPDALRAQLGSVLPSGEGAMIREVAPNSPAARAKLRVYDILTAYNDQKIFSAEQLSHMVWASNPDKAVKLRLVHNGTAQDIQITLDAVQTVAEPTYPSIEISMDTGSAAGNRESFDSISLMKLKNGNSRAEVQYFGKDGKLVKQDFTGTPDAIREQIMKQPDIPAAERNQLLQALNTRNIVFFPPLPTGWIAPGLFMPPWFDRPPYF